MGVIGLQSCFTCRRRRTKCDRGQPSCQTCATTGLICEGYEQAVTFVNVDSSNIKERKKKVYVEAIKSRSQKRSLPTAGPNTPPSCRDTDHPTTPNVRPTERPSLRASAIFIPEMSEADFDAYTTSLHSKFVDEHAITSRAWSLHLQHLLHQSRSFDLAIIALSALRVAQTSQDNDLHIISLTAYDESMKIFQGYCQDVCASPIQDPPAMMTIISLIYCLYEFMQETPLTILDSGLIEHNPHLHGVIGLMQRSGPEDFQTGGYHLAFKKAREMAVLSALSRREESFLAKDEWMSGPWAVTKKHDRDLLYDVLAKVTLLWQSARDDASTDITMALASISQLRNAVHHLEQTWTAKRMPSFHQTIAPTPTQADSLMLDLEAKAVHLLLKLASIRLVTGSANTEASRGTAQLSAATQYSKIRQALRQDPFNRHLSRPAGIIEADCRSLLAIWVLRQYDEMMG